MVALNDSSSATSNNASSFMTTQVSAQPQPFMPDPKDKVACTMQEAMSKDSCNIRGYSDSVVPTCRATENNHQKLFHLAARLQNVLAAASHESKDTSIPNMRTRLSFQLPSFHALGIASRPPDGPLTPPDEGTIHFRGSAPPTWVPGTSSSLPSNMPKYPVSGSPHAASLQASDLPMSEASGRHHSATPAAEAEAKGEDAEEEGQGPMSSSSEEDELPPDQARWLLETANAVVFNVDLNTMGHIVNVFCHSQPCPLSNETVNATTWPNITSAIGGLLSAIQNKIDSSDRCIDIVHAVPLKFNMAQIPTSPATTPTIQKAHSDYFNFSIIVDIYSKAVVAIDHQEAQNTGASSSPHNVVPPATINFSLLERFIPPSSAEEYLNLFTTDGPSVLVSRLIELSPESGSLLFIYPTGAGAQTFATTYLGPLLHPLLRTMVSIHNLSMDFGAAVGKIAAVDQMLPFETMVRKLQILFRKLGRGSSAMRTNPKFTLVESSKQLVQLDRRVWTEWWVQQETGRIRTVVERYLQRGVMVPGGKDVTAATLVQEVLDGVRTRKYVEIDAEREGVEVGVFVIKRTA